MKYLKVNLLVDRIFFGQFLCHVLVLVNYFSTTNFVCLLSFGNSSILLHHFVSYLAMGNKSFKKLWLKEVWGASCAIEHLSDSNIVLSYCTGEFLPSATTYWCQDEGL